MKTLIHSELFDKKINDYGLDSDDVDKSLEGAFLNITYNIAKDPFWFPQVNESNFKYRIAKIKTANELQEIKIIYLCNTDDDTKLELVNIEISGAA